MLTSMPRRAPQPLRRPNVSPERLEAALADEMRAMRARLAALDAEVAQLRAHAPRGGPLTDKDLRVGARVAAKIGNRKYALAEVVTIYVSDAGDRLYALSRLDDARKGISPKPAAELYPEAFANAPEEDAG